MRVLAVLVVASSLVLGARSVAAVDGVLEINHACAVNTGCFAGDTAGFPVCQEPIAVVKRKNARVEDSLVVMRLPTFLDWRA